MQPTDHDAALVGELLDLALALAVELQALAPPGTPVSPALHQALARVVPTLQAQTQAERDAAEHYRHAFYRHLGTPQ